MINEYERNDAIHKYHDASWKKIKGQQLPEAWAHLKSHMISSLSNDHRVMVLIVLTNPSLVLTHSKIVSVGAIDHITIDMKLILEEALKHDAYGAIVAHNHTNDNFLPTWHDVSFTTSLNEACRKLSVELLDHVVISDQDIFSLRKACLVL